MTEILLIGTFHFSEETRFPYSSAAIKAQLDDFAHRFLPFGADAVAVELEKARGALRIFEDIPHGEAREVGGRLAKVAGLDTLHPIDVKMPLPSALLEGGGQALIQPRLSRMKEGELRQSSILDLYRWLNSEACINNDRNMYLDLNAIADQPYTHSHALARWYERNLCIFSNIQQLAKTYQNIIVLYGAGHLTIFRDLINACDQMKLIDANDFLW